MNDLGRTVLITGGAGFIGSNLAARLLTQSQASIRIFDNLSRRNVATNLTWLQSLPGAGDRLTFHLGDVRNAHQVCTVMSGCTEVYHLAAQVAVTTSVLDPVEDFSINALGTLNVLEAARSQPQSPFLLFTSTNKVYGGLEMIPVRMEGLRYVPIARKFSGVDESAPLDFHSPYGCSKGAADQYVRDYARIYNLPTIVFRMSCICGPRQFGTEDQGWVAHFLYSMLCRRAITVYGSGCQVRDILHVDDLLDAMEAVRMSKGVPRGSIFNLGGGKDQARSVNEMLASIEELLEVKRQVRYGEIRPGDQPLYISDTTKLFQLTGWKPSRHVRKILEDILAFGSKHSEVISEYSYSLSAQAEGMVA